MVDALRQCEGSRLQAVVLVRDDFYLSVNRVFQELEIRLLEGHNYSVVDLFDPDHARRVLKAFGHAYGKLNEDLSAEQEEFLNQAVAAGTSWPGTASRRTVTGPPRRPAASATWAFVWPEVRLSAS